MSPETLIELEAFTREIALEAGQLIVDKRNAGDLDHQ